MSRALRLFPGRFSGEELLPLELQRNSEHRTRSISSWRKIAWLLYGAVFCSSLQAVIFQPDASNASIPIDFPSWWSPNIGFVVALRRKKYIPTGKIPAYRTLSRMRIHPFCTVAVPYNDRRHTPSAINRPLTAATKTSNPRPPPE